MAKDKIKVSYSALMQFAKSPNHYIHYRDSKFEPTAAMEKGSLIHKLILEPDKVDIELAIWKGKVRRGKEWDEFQAANNGKMIIKESDYYEAKHIADRVLGNETVMPLLNQITQTEFYFKFDYDDEIIVHGFKDGAGDDIVMDLKTGSDVSPRKFRRSIIDLGYHVQGALYTWENREPYYILGVETTAPYNVQMFRLDEEFIEAGRNYVTHLINTFKEWVADGQKPAGYEFWQEYDVINITPPEWMLASKQ